MKYISWDVFIKQDPIRTVYAGIRMSNLN